MMGMGSDLVREARRRVGWTQADLARAAGTSQPAIARLESGRTAVSFDDVIRLLRLTGLDLDLMLVERDGSDWSQAARALQRTPEERHDELVAWNRSAGRLRDAYERPAG